MFAQATTLNYNAEWIIVPVNHQFLFAIITFLSLSRPVTGA